MAAAVAREERTAAHALPLPFSLSLPLCLPHSLSPGPREQHQAQLPAIKKEEVHKDGCLGGREREKERKIDLPAHDESASAITATRAFPSRLTQLSLHPLSLCLLLSLSLSAIRGDKGREQITQEREREREREEKKRQSRGGEGREKRGRERKKEQIDRNDSHCHLLSLPLPLTDSWFRVARRQPQQ